MKKSWPNFKTNLSLANVLRDLVAAPDPIFKLKKEIIVEPQNYGDGADPED